MSPVTIRPIPNKELWKWFYINQIRTKQSITQTVLNVNKSFSKEDTNVMLNKNYITEKNNGLQQGRNT